MIRKDLLPDWLVLELENNFTEEEINSLEAFYTEDNRYLGIGFDREGIFTQHSEPAKVYVISKIEQFMEEKGVKLFYSTSAFNPVFEIGDVIYKDFEKMERSVLYNFFRRR